MKFRLPIMIITFLLIATLLSACSLDFIYPFLIRDTSGGDLTHPTIAVDPGGRKYIAGLNSDSRVVYYRTYLGPAESIKTMAVDAKYDQDSPEIAVLDDGTAVLVWIEYMKLSTQYKACYTMIPLSGPYINTCDPLDAGHLGTGLVHVVARGNDAYIIYDRVEGDLTTLFYKQVAGGSAAGRIDLINNVYGEITSTNMAIDSAGNLHVVWYLYRPDDYDYMYYSSNAAVDAEGDMDQEWTLLYDNFRTNINYPVGISFFTSGTDEMVVMAFQYNDDDFIDGNEILIIQCTAVGCADGTSAWVPLTYGYYWSVNQVNLVGSGDQYHISFIDHQSVWLYTGPTDSSLTQKTTTDNWKTDLNMVLGGGFPVLGYTYSFTSSDNPAEAFVNIPIIGNKQVFYKDGCPSVGSTDMASNNSDVAGVWTACGHTWFSTNAYKSSLPLIVR